MSETNIKGLISSDSLQDSAATRISLAFLKSIGIDSWFRIERRKKGPVLAADGPKDFVAEYAPLVASGADPFLHFIFDLPDTEVTGSDAFPYRPDIPMAARGYVYDFCDKVGSTSGFSPVTPGPADSRWNLLSNDWNYRDADQLSKLYKTEIDDALSLLEGGFAHAGDTLSTREAECLELVANGKRIGQIADRLDIAEVTIEYHLRNCRTKLGARTRDQAVAKAVSRGIIRVD